VVLQLYGQERNERYRKTADDAVKQQGIVLRGLADTVEQQGAEINRIGARIDRIGAGVEKQGAELSSIANAISDIASEAQSAATYPRNPLTRRP
jgi:methyl-accepting chemotaxis protein